VILSDASGRVVLHTAYADAARAPPPAEPSSLQRAVTSARPVAGNLARGPRGEWGVPVRYPVLRDGQVKYVLTGVLKPQAIRQVVDRQRVPGDWVVSVFDATQMRIARSKAHEAQVGTGPSPSLRELMASGAPENLGMTTTLEGERIYSAYVRLPDSGWTVAAGRSTAAFETDLRRAVAAYGAAIVASLLVATTLALWFARRVSGPIEQLRSAAGAMGRGEPPQMPRTGIDEVDDVGSALLEAARERDRSEADREALLAEAQQARAQAEQANRAKDEFLAMLGHELRNPLAPIVTALELMKMRHPEVAERERAVIERQVRHLARLVDDLLDVSRVAQGKVQLELACVDLREVAVKALELTAPSPDDHARIELHVPGEPVCVKGDEVRLVQVACNLVVNALKFTPRPGAIRLDVQAQGNEALLIVSDNGMGIAPHLLPRVFDLFVQGEQALDRRDGGLGLGLGIARMLVQMHGGSITADSAGVGKGSCFTVRLPRIDEPEAVLPAGSSPGAAAARRGARVLVVDDNEDAAQSLADVLRDAGYEVLNVQDGATALQTVRDFEPHAAVLDIGLPGMDGYALARALRADPRHKDLVIIALTGYGREGDRARALAGDFDEHLVKPVKTQALLEAMERKMR
jgi:signal transduction histidine kinase